MKHTFSIFIVDPATGNLVAPENWAEMKNAKDAEFVAIKREDGSGIIIAKNPVSVDGNVNFDWNKAVELAKAFKASTNLGGNVGPEGFRLMDRREALDIYDARFQGLDDALDVVGGTPLNEGDARWMWTEDEDPDPEYNSYGAFLFNGDYGGVGHSHKSNTTTVRPVSAFLPF